VMRLDARSSFTKIDMPLTSSTVTKTAAKAITPFTTVWSSGHVLYVPIARGNGHAWVSHGLLNVLLLGNVGHGGDRSLAKELDG